MEIYEGYLCLTNNTKEDQSSVESVIVFFSLARNHKSEVRGRKSGARWKAWKEKLMLLKGNQDLVRLP